MDELIKEDPELQQIKRRDILRSVKDLHDRIGGENLGKGDIRALMKTIKEKRHRPGDPLEGTSQMYEDVDPGLEEAIERGTKKGCTAGDKKKR